MSNQIDLEVGDIFYYDNGFGVHYHVIVAEHHSGSNCSLMLVYLSSENSIFKDTTTVFHPGDHEVITEESWVRYQNVIVCQKDSVIPFVKRHHGKVNEEMLSKIQKGILASNKVSRRDKALFIEWNHDRLFGTM